MEENIVRQIRNDQQAIAELEHILANIVFKIVQQRLITQVVDGLDENKAFLALDEALRSYTFNKYVSTN